MTSEVELISDGEGLVVAGPTQDVERFLEHAALTSNAKKFHLGRLSALLKTTGALAKTASGIAEQSAYYLKLTPESAQRLQEAGGLMKTKTKGISHAMLGDPGKVNKWLQVEDGPASLLTNPAVLSGVGGLLSQFAQQGEAQQLKALLVRLDEKLDEVQRTQRDEVLAKLFRAAAAIEEAMILHESGGDAATLWAKVSGEASTILEVQDATLLRLDALADRLDGEATPGALRKATGQIERDIATQLAILARCFELQDEFRIVELDHVLATAPQNLDGHRLGLAKARQKRRADVLERTARIMKRMEAAGAIANANIILHARAARSVIGSLNATAGVITDFHAPLGIESGRMELGVPRWREAVRDRRQLKQATAEAARKAAVTGASVAAVAVATVGAKSISNRDT